MLLSFGTQGAAVTKVVCAAMVPLEIHVYRLQQLYLL